jgi:hypothetical protein
MIPLSYFLIAWATLLAIFGVMMFVTLIQMLRHGLPSLTTYVSTFVFLLVTAGVVIGTSLYLTRVDWSTQIQLLPAGSVPFLSDEPSNEAL